jgi:hypothetical protein
LSVLNFLSGISIVIGILLFLQFAVTTHIFLGYHRNRLNLKVIRPGWVKLPSPREELVEASEDPQTLSSIIDIC